MPRLLLAAIAAAALAAVRPAPLSAQDRFPRPEFESGYALPQIQTPAPRDALWQFADTAVLVLLTVISALGALRWRKRIVISVCSAAALAYFGFLKRGCICPVGSVQNVSAALSGVGGGVGVYVAAFFILPLISSLLFGRVFCGGVCPFGAVQEFLFLKPIRIPRILDRTLRALPPLFLGFAVLMSATASGFPICRIDPFVGIFRFSFPASTALLTLGFVVLSIFVARPYCRWLCPYGALHALAATLSRKRLSISPAECVECRLCESSCPVGAIRPPTVEPPSEEKRRSRKGLAMHFALAPLYLAAGMALGTAARPLAYPFNPDIALEKAVLSENSFTRGSTLDTETFLSSGKSMDELHDAARAAKNRLSLGLLLYGAYAGGVIWTLIAIGYRRRKKSGYDPDPLACVSCGRCLSSCPVPLGGIGPSMKKGGGA